MEQLMHMDETVEKVKKEMDEKVENINKKYKTMQEEIYRDIKEKNDCLEDMITKIDLRMDKINGKEIDDVTEEASDESASH